MLFLTETYHNHMVLIGYNRGKWLFSFCHFCHCQGLYFWDVLVPLNHLIFNLYLKIAYFTIRSNLLSTSHRELTFLIFEKRCLVFANLGDFIKDLLTVYNMNSSIWKSTTDLPHFIILLVFSYSWKCPVSANLSAMLHHHHNLFPIFICIWVVWEVFNFQWLSMWLYVNFMNRSW